MSMFLPLCVVLSYILHSAHSVNVKIYPDICKEKVFPKLVEGYRFVHDDVPVIPQLSVKHAEMEKGEKGNSDASDAAGMKEDPKSMPLLSGPVLTPVGTKNASFPSARDSATGEAEGPRILAALHTLGQTHHIKRPQSVPENCQRDPDIISVGAVKRFTTRKPRYPVVIEYGCGRQAGREYKYVTGTTEAKCDHKGWWTLPALLCAPVGCYLKHWGRAVYAGNVSVTVSGRTCQPWTADTPHVRNRFCRSTSLYYVDGSVSAAGNSCRDPDGTGKPWCYTTDPMKRWEICNIQECRRERECGSPPNIPGATPIQTQVKVHGVDVTYTCRDGMTYMSGEKTISCDMATEQWSEPTLLCYAKRCFYVDYLRNQSIYGGQEDHSASGLQCQSFDRQTPHRHTWNKTEMFPLELSLADVGNQCRDPDGEMTPWCYTVSPKKRWEYCAVPQC